jgi:hypothetical protein
MRFGLDISQNQLTVGRDVRARLAEDAALERRLVFGHSRRCTPTSGVYCTRNCSWTAAANVLQGYNYVDARPPFWIIHLAPASPASATARR